jgi:hypothetical protein
LNIQSVVLALEVRPAGPMSCPGRPVGYRIARANTKITQLRAPSSQKKKKATGAKVDLAEHPKKSRKIRWKGGDGSSRTLAMAGDAGCGPREWLAVDETAAAFLFRSLSTRPPILLPPPLHRAPLRPGNVVEIAGPSNSGKSQLLLMVSETPALARFPPKFVFAYGAKYSGSTLGTCWSSHLKLVECNSPLHKF